MIPANMLPSYPPDKWVDRRKPAEMPDRADRDDLEMVAWAIGERGTKCQVTRAYKLLWVIMQRINLTGEP